jgi:soluble lytic murein transglycosylase-like protein
MPSTAAEYRVVNAYDPAENIRAGVAYLKSLLTRFGDDVSLALAAYNAGPTTPKIVRTVTIVDGREVVKYTNPR